MTRVELRTDRIWYRPYLPMIAGTVFLIPSMLVILRSELEISSTLLKLSIVSIPIGLALSSYWMHIEQYPIIDSDTPETMEIIDEYDRELLKTEYEQISEEVRYRNRLVLRTSYFSFATLGALAVLFVRVPSIWQPFIATFGIFISFTFGVYTAVYKQTRDKLWERQLELESRVQTKGILSIAHTILSDDRSWYHQYYNLTERITELHLYLFIIWLLLYTITTVNALWDFILFGPK